MKAATQALRQLIERGESIYAKPLLFAEWEHNRFSEIESVSVTPAQVADDEFLNTFPVESVKNANRPRTGIAKARLGSSKLRASSTYRDIPQSSRFYLPSETDAYKYFSSTQKTKLVQENGSYNFDAPIEITLMYKDFVLTNKIVAGFETSYAKPTSFSIEINDGTSWRSIVNAPTLPANGIYQVWRNSVDNWSEEVDYVSPVFIKGIRLKIFSMDEPFEHVDVIQLGARLENDLSDFVESYSCDFEVSDRSWIAPFGKASSNVSSLSLSNIDGRFKDTNEQSLYYGLIGKKVKMTMYMSFDVSKNGGSEDERITEFTMWSDSWRDQEEESVTVDLKDSSVILQEIDMPTVFWENISVGAIIWQLMDLIGLTNYQYLRSTLDSGQILPYFWPTDDGSIWDQISQLAEGTQTAVYFDEYDVLQISTKNSFINPSKGIDWNLDAVLNGQKLPDVIDISGGEEIVTNSVDINYKPAKFSDFNNGLPKLETVWEPEGETLTLRSTSLVRTLNDADTYMWIRNDQALLWPYESMINIRGEILSYKGKEYTYYLPGGGMASEFVYSLEDKTAIDAKSDPNLRWANSFTGKLIIDKRGIAGSGVAGHSVTPNRYSGIVTNYYNTDFFSSSSGINFNNGMMTLTSPQYMGTTPMQGIYVARHEAAVNGSDTMYGTRLRFPVDAVGQGNFSNAGIWFGGDDGDAGYYLEICTTDTVERLEPVRVWRHEASLVLMPANGAGYRIATNYEGDGKGWPVPIVAGRWYDIDIRHKRLPDNRTAITLFVDGVFAGDWYIAAAAAPPGNNRFGAFVRWYSSCEFEYMYAVNAYEYFALEEAGRSAADESTFLDLQKGGFSSGYIEREWRYGAYLSSVANLSGQRVSQISARSSYVMDEFQPVVHEIRKFEVKFSDENIPCSHSSLYITNEQIVCLDYTSDAFGATFTLVNASRYNAIAKGEDILTLGTDNPITHSIFVYGRKLYQEDDLSINKKDDYSIQKNGKSILTFDNRFVQTKEAAEDLAQWVVNIMSGGSDELTVTTFGNSLIQVGDKVTMNYPVKNMTPGTHKYYVVKKSNSFTAGLETSLTLRRLTI